MFVGDYEETGSNMRKTDGMTVQEYHYQCRRTRNSRGEPYGPTHSSYLELTLRNFSDTFEAQVLRDMKSSRPANYSFLFNAGYEDNQIVKNFTEALILSGFIVNLTESYSCLKDDNQEKGDRIMNMKIQILSIKYLSNNNGLILEVNKTN